MPLGVRNIVDASRFDAAELVAVGADNNLLL
jgi:hypothetical protein